MERTSGINERPFMLMRSENVFGEPLSAPACNSVLVIEVPGHVQGKIDFCVENAPNCSHFISSSNQPPNGLASSEAFILVPENELHKFNATGGAVGPQFNGAKKVQIFDFQVPFSMVSAPKAAQYSDMYLYDRKFITHELLREQSAAFPQSGKLFGDSGVMLSYPSVRDEYFPPTAKVANGSDKFHNRVERVPGRTVTNQGTLMSNFAVVNKITPGWLSSPTGPIQVPPESADTYGTSHVNSKENPSKGESSGSLHENTEDLEALMSFEEDEASTGRSPTELACNDSPEGLSSESSMNSCVGTHKRKSCESQWLDEDEVDVLFQEAQSELRENHCVELIDHNDQDDGNTGRAKGNSSTRSLESVVDRRTVTKLSSLESIGVCDTVLDRHSSVSGYSYVRKRPRAEKIKRMVNLLRNIIPGGNYMDTLDVLGEAIQYVRTLHSEVLKLETTKGLKIL